jgi:hypothetical protein
VRECLTWGWILIAVFAVIAVLAITVAVRATLAQKRSERLEEHFGPDRGVGDCERADGFAKRAGASPDADANGVIG